MSHAFRGRPLERGFIGGARHYRRHQGRKVVLVKQHTPMFQDADGRLEYSAAGAPVDLIGGVNGVPCGIEAKQTAVDHFPLDDRKKSQRDALRVLFDCEFIVGMAIDFTTRREVYLIWWPAVVAFEAAPWRRSLSRDWCMANGLLLPELQRDSDDDRATLFLDGAPHPERAAAIKRVEADQHAHSVITLDQQLAADDARDRRWAERQRQDPIAPMPKPGTPEYRERILASMNAGIARQLGGRGRARGPRRKGGRG